MGGGGHVRDLLPRQMHVESVADAAIGRPQPVQYIDQQESHPRLGAIVADAGQAIAAGNPLRLREHALREWHTRQLDRLPGLKFMRTLWVATVSGGPFQFTPTRPGSTTLGLEEAHRNLRISPREFDAVAAVLSRSLDHFAVPPREKSEVLAAFAAHKNEVTEGWRQAHPGRS